MIKLYLLLQLFHIKHQIIITSLFLPLFLLACDPFYFVYSSSFMFKMNFVFLLYLKFNHGGKIWKVLLLGIFLFFVFNRTLSIYGSQSVLMLTRLTCSHLSGTTPFIQRIWTPYLYYTSTTDQLDQPNFGMPIKVKNVVGAYKRIHTAEDGLYIKAPESNVWTILRCIDSALIYGPLMYGPLMYGQNSNVWIASIPMYEVPMYEVPMSPTSCLLNSYI